MSLCIWQQGISHRIPCCSWAQDTISQVWTMHNHENNCKIAFSIFLAHTLNFFRTQILFGILFFFFLAAPVSCESSQGQGSNPSHDSNHSHSSDNTGALTHWATRERHHSIFNTLNIVFFVFSCTTSIPWITIFVYYFSLTHWHVLCTLHAIQKIVSKCCWG